MKERVEVKLHEVLHIALADTVVNPRTMVVHLENTVATFSAVMGSLWLPCLPADTLLTVLYLQL